MMINNTSNNKNNNNVYLQFFISSIPLILLSNFILFFSVPCQCHSVILVSCTVLPNHHHHRRYHRHHLNDNNSSSNHTIQILGIASKRNNYYDYDYPNENNHNNENDINNNNNNNNNNSNSSSSKKKLRKQQYLIPNQAHLFQFERYQSPQSIRHALSYHLQPKYDQPRNEVIKTNNNNNNIKRPSSFQFYKGKDGRKGYISCIKLGNTDYVLAQSEQIAKQTTTKEVLLTYLNGTLQTKWNSREVLKCNFSCKDIDSSSLKEDNSHDNDYNDENDSHLGHNNNNYNHQISGGSSSSDCSSGGSNDNDGCNDNVKKNNRNANDYYFSFLQLQQKVTKHWENRLIGKGKKVIKSQNDGHLHKSDEKYERPTNDLAIKTMTGKYYQQDLTLHSQRVITSHTGIMRYQQEITIDQIGDDKYCVIVKLVNNDTASSGTTTKLKPFDSLLVHVGLVQEGNDVHIYADGIMKVNRKVVPNLIVFDASGIAGQLAGKGTLWLGAYFEERRKQDEKLRDIARQN